MTHNDFIRYKLSILFLKLISSFVPVKKYRRRLRLFLNKKFKIDYNKNYIVREYLKKYTYSPTESFQISKIESLELPIWQLWFQGEESAPAIVKRCLDSVRKFSGNRKVILLTEDNIREYVELPQYIWDKKEQSIISNTHFSDILRVCLLEKFGGTWIDATVLLTDHIPQNILSQDFFAFSVPEGHINYDFHLFSNWFMHAQPNHPIVISIKESLLKYWESENKLVDYFIFHLISYNNIKSQDVLNDLWDKVYYIDNVAVHEMQFGLIEPYSEDKFEYYKKQSTIHKLTYKINKVNEGVLLDKLIQVGV